MNKTEPKTDVSSDYDHSIHCNPQAQPWAQFFCETAKELIHKGRDPQELLMDCEWITGWFANAMTAMHDWVMKTQCVSLISARAQSPTATQEETKSAWIRTATRPPTKEDGDDNNHVLAWKPFMGVQEIPFRYVEQNSWPFWMPIPLIPEQSMNEPSGLH